MNKLGLVSVIIPCYNQSHFLKEAIESIRGQTYNEYEIIVINDGSTDQTGAVARKFSNVRLIEQNNTGLASARNAGLYESKGEFVVFLDSDDRLLPRSLETGVRVLRQHPECAFVSGFCNYIDFDGSNLPFIAQPQIADESDHYTALLQKNYIWSPANVMYRRSIFEQVSGFDTAINPTADYELYLRIAKHFSVLQHGEIVAEYRQHVESMSSNHARMLKYILQVFELQWEYVKSNRRYKKAWVSGIIYYLYLYGKKNVRHVFSLAKRREWRKAVQESSTFLSYPRVIFKYITLIFSKTSSIESKEWQ
jgi:glycosyltransferase involved in cell wall biosynthesis